MNFAEIHRAFMGYKQRMDDEAILSREVAYPIYQIICGLAKKPAQPKNIWWPIGDIKGQEVTQEYTDEVYRKHGKYGKN